MKSVRSERSSERARVSEMAQPETAKTKDTAVVTTRDNARAYTAALVSPGVRSRVAPLPAPRIVHAECGMWFPHSAAHRSARVFAPELLGGRLAHCQPQALGGVIALAGTPHARAELRTREPRACAKGDETAARRGHPDAGAVRCLSAGLTGGRAAGGARRRRRGRWRRPPWSRSCPAWKQN